MPSTDTPPLREAIIRHLQEEGSDSISGVARVLSKLESAPVHRLTIAGHLAAMTEEGILKEVARPPSKHYQLADPIQHQDIYQRAATAIGELDLPAPDRATGCVAVLSQIFARPIYLAELQRCGFQNAGRGSEQVDATEEQRRGIRHLFRNEGANPMDIPRGDPLIQPLPGAVSSATVQEALRLIALAGTGSNSLVAPRPGPGGTQSRLALGEIRDN